MNSPSRALVLATLAGFAFTTSAHAQSLSWTNAGGGTASTAGNWSPAAVPTSANDLVYNLVANYGVIFNSSTVASRTQTFKKGTVSLSMTSPHTTTSGVTIGDVSGDSSVVNFLTGTWNSTFNSTTGFDLGNVAGSSGTLNINDDSADLLLPGTNARIRVGVGGTGALSITNGGRVDCGNGIIVASNTGSSGSLTVSGAQNVLPFARSTLSTSNTAGITNFGSSGSATVAFSNGALVDIASNVSIGEAGNGTSTVTVGGAGGVLNSHATFNVGGNLLIATNSIAGLAAIGTLTVNNAGDVNVGGALEVGNDAQGGSGTLNINTGALVSAGSVIDGPFGSINHLGGTLKINGGSYTGHAVPLVVTGAAANDVTLQLSNNLSKTLTPSGGVSLIVGDDIGAGSFAGNLIIDSGADLNTGDGDINIGDDAGVTGLITVTGAGTNLIATQPNCDVRVGFAGSGELDVLAGAHLQCKNLLVPALPGGVGFLNASGTNSDVTTQFLVVGQSSGGGSGLLQVQSNATLNVTDPGFSTSVRSTGTLLIASLGTFSTPGTVIVNPGGLLQVQGIVNGATLVDVSGRLISATNSSFTPLVDAPVHVGSGGVVEAIVDDFTMGKTTIGDSLNFDSGSVMRIGADTTLTLLGRLPAGSPANDINADGAIEMQGGTLSSPVWLLMDGAAADQISGFGTIDAGVRTNTLGTCTPTGSGLVFLRELFLNGTFDAVGTAIRFGPTCIVKDLGSAHTFNCKITADAGSIMMPNNGNTFGFATVTMGDGSATGVTLNGIIHLGTSGNLTFNDSNGTPLGSLTDMNGGSLNSTNGLILNSGRVLRGHGTLNVSNLSGNGLLNSGTIDPDDYFSDTDTYHDFGTFTVNGRYTQQAAGTFLCEVGGYDNEFRPLNDRINAGPVVLNGTLNVSLINGYNPSLCDTFTIVSGSSVSGTFATVVAPHGVRVVYNPTNVQLVISGCPADFNGDCTVDFFDYLDFVDAFSAGLMTADFNNDTVLDFFDYLDFVDHFSAGC